MADLVGDGVSENALFSDVHGKDALNTELQHLSPSMRRVSAVPVRDVLSQLVGELFRSALSGYDCELPYWVGRDHYRDNRDRGLLHALIIRERKKEHFLYVTYDDLIWKQADAERGGFLTLIASSSCMSAWKRAYALRLIAMRQSFL